MQKRAIKKDPKTGLYVYVFELPPTYTPNGTKRRNRKTVKRKNKKDLVEEIDRLDTELRARGTLTTGGLSVEQWFTRWLEEATKELRPNTVVGYRSVIRNHVIPALGPRTKLEKVTADRIRAVYRAMTESGLSSTYMLNAHRVMSSSFADAVREGLLVTNPCTLVKPPRKNAVELDVLTPSEASGLLLRLVNDVDETGDNESLRWATAIITGVRRGEAIGFELDRIDLSTPGQASIDISWQIQRLPHAHGCGGTCGRRRGGDCPQKQLIVPADYEYRHCHGGLYWTRPKTNAGQRIMPLPQPLEDKFRALVSQPRNEWGLAFLMDGKPRDPDADTAAWRALKDRLFPGRRVRLHDLRHVAVDLMYEAGVPEDIIQELVGHSTRAMSRAYKSKGNHNRLHGNMARVANLVTRQEVETGRMREIGA